jgi:hypothetical protein
MLRLTDYKEPVLVGWRLDDEVRLIRGLVFLSHLKRLPIISVF